MNPLDHPFDEVVTRAQTYIKSGATIFQKWTCDACGERVAFDEPNTFFERGTHDDCKVDPLRVTNIKYKGCNYVLLRQFRIDNPDTSV